jgi:hypothetical protein
MHRKLAERWDQRYKTSEHNSSLEAFPPGKSRLRCRLNAVLRRPASTTRLKPVGNKSTSHGARSLTEQGCSTTSDYDSPTPTIPSSPVDGPEAA